VRSKLKFIVPVPILLAVAAVYLLGIYPPKHKAAAKPKVDGTLVQLPTDFVVNLAGGHYGKVSIALLLSSPPPASATTSNGTVLPQDAEIRATITDQLTGIDPSELVDRSARHKLLAHLLADLKQTTDEPVTQVLITDLAVQ
jgi:flagellar basal body-associated protein FliL